MGNATRVVVSTFGALIGLAGVEHGIGEVLQGNLAPAGTVILSWPGPGPFAGLGGEPAVTIVPNLVITGILAILVSLAFMACATLFVRRKHSGLGLLLLAGIMLLVGGGFGPPLFGFIIGAVASRSAGPLAPGRTRPAHGLRHVLAQAWPWSFSACLIDWLLMFPGLVILSYYFGVNDPNLVLVLLIGMFGLLSLTIATGWAWDDEIACLHRPLLLPPRRP